MALKGMFIRPCQKNIRCNHAGDVSLKILRMKDKKTLEESTILGHRILKFMWMYRLHRGFSSFFVNFKIDT